MSTEMIWRALLVAGMLALAAVEVVAAGGSYYVSPDGRDNWSGKLDKPNAARTDGPFETLIAARDAIRALKARGPLPAGGVTVLIEDGEYPQAQSFSLGAEDSGTAEAPIIYRAAVGARPRLVGGRRLPTSAFKPLQDGAVLARLVPSAHGQVMMVDLKALGITDLGRFPDRFRGAPDVPELFVNNQRMTLARWPNQGWAHIAKIIDSGNVPRVGEKGHRGGTFTYTGDEPARWKIDQGVWLEGYWCFDWFDETIQVKSLDPQTKQITLAEPTVYGVKFGNPSPRRWRALNVLEELDEPGEYYIDRTRGRLYLWPPEKLAGARIVLSTLDAPIVSITDASHVTLRGLIIEAGLGDGVDITGGQQDAILACEIRNMRQLGVDINGGTRHRLQACDIHDTGTGGVTMSGGDRKTLTPSGHEAINNHIWRFSIHQLTGAYAFSCSGVGNLMSHNLISDAPHQAIGIHGNDNIFEYNIVHDVCTATDDCGAYYKGRNPSCRGNIVRYNFWYNIGSPMGHGNAAIYFDDGDGGDSVIGNVFFRCGEPGKGSFGTIFSHGGFDLLAQNNIFIECKRPLGSAPWSYQRYMNFLKDPQYRKLLVKDVDITSKTYTKHYPELIGFLNMTPERPRVSKAIDNLMVMCAAVSSGNWQVPPDLNWSTDQDPGFVDIAKGDFRLKPDSSVFKRLPGFKPVPFERMGLVKSELRPTLPVEKWTYPPPHPLPPLMKQTASVLPAKTTPPPVFKVVKAATAPRIDGVLSAGEWCGPVMRLAQNVNGTAARPPSRAWLSYDAGRLYVAIENEVAPNTNLDGNQWGTSEAVEFSLQAAKGKPIYVLRGYPNGHIQFGRTPNSAEEPLTMDPGEIVYRAHSPKVGEWVAEMSLPLAMLGIDPAKTPKVACNVTVRKVQGDLWLMWEGTQAHSYDVARAGVLEFK